MKVQLRCQPPSGDSACCCLVCTWDTLLVAAGGLRRPEADFMPVVHAATGLTELDTLASETGLQSTDSDDPHCRRGAPPPEANFTSYCLCTAFTNQPPISGVAMLRGNATKLNQWRCSGRCARQEARGLQRPIVQKWRCRALTDNANVKTTTIMSSNTNSLLAIFGDLFKEYELFMKKLSLFNNNKKVA